jgi:hypothetical protein
MIRLKANAQSPAHLHTFHLIGQWKVNHIESHGPGSYQDLHIPRKKRKIFHASESSTAAKKWKCRSMTRKSAILREMLQWTDKSIDSLSLSCRQRRVEGFRQKNFKNFSKKFPKKNFKKIHLKFIQLKNCVRSGSDVSQMFRRWKWPITIRRCWVSWSPALKFKFKFLKSYLFHFNFFN